MATKKTAKKSAKPGYSFSTVPATPPGLMQTGYGEFRPTGNTALPAYNVPETAIYLPQAMQELTPQIVEQPRSELDLLLEKMRGQPGYTKTEFSPRPYSPTTSASERARSLVEAQYGGRAASLNSQMGTLNTQLAKGQAVQKNYAQFGDAKLKQIYDSLTQGASEVAAKTSSIYADGQSGVSKAYDDAARTSLANKQQTLATLAADTGNSEALPEAIAAVQQTAATNSTAMSADKADSLANIITLGANMGAAALKDVTMTQTLGANTRKDLVNSVQATLVKLQEEHDAVTADLSSQLQQLEAQRSSALQSATTQIEIDDADRRFTYDMAKSQHDNSQEQSRLAQEQTNLKNMIDILTTQSNLSNDVSSRRLAEEASVLNKQVFNQNTLNNNRNWALAAKAQGLDENKFKHDQIKEAFDQYIAKQGLTLDYAKMSESQRQANMDAVYKSGALQLDIERLGLQKSEFSSNNFYKGIELTQKQKELELSQTQDPLKRQKLEQEILKIKSDTKKNNAAAAVSAQKLLTDANSTKLVKFGSGPTGYANYKASLTANANSKKALDTEMEQVNTEMRKRIANKAKMGTASTPYTTQFEAFQVAHELFSKSSDTLDAKGTLNLDASTGSGPSPELLKALQIYYSGK